MLITLFFKENLERDCEKRLSTWIELGGCHGS